MRFESTSQKAQYTLNSQVRGAENVLHAREGGGARSLLASASCSRQSMCLSSNMVGRLHTARLSSVAAAPLAHGWLAPKNQVQEAACLRMLT